MLKLVSSHIVYNTRVDDAAERNIEQTRRLPRTHI